MKRWFRSVRAASGVGFALLSLLVASSPLLAVSTDPSGVSIGGKIVVGGGSNNGLYKDYVVTRLNTDGTTDASFGIGSFGVAGVRAWRR